MSELEAQWQHQEQVGHTEYYPLGTPRSDWYDSPSDYAYVDPGHQDQGGATGQFSTTPDQDNTVPSRVGNLATYLSDRQAGGLAQSTEQPSNGGWTSTAVATHFMQGQPTGGAGFQGSHSPGADGLPGGSDARNSVTSPHVSEVPG